MYWETYKVLESAQLSNSKPYLGCPEHLFKKSSRHHKQVVKSAFGNNYNKLNYFCILLHLRFIIDWNTPNDHCHWAKCDCTMGVSRLSKIPNIKPIIIFIFSNDWSPQTCWRIVCIATNNVYAFFRWCCSIIRYSWL